MKILKFNPIIMIMSLLFFNVIFIVGFGGFFGLHITYVAPFSILFSIFMGIFISKDVV